MMNNCRRFIVGLAVACGVALGSCQKVPADLSTAPLASAHIGGAFNLIDQNGRRVSDRDFSGKFIITYFGYTSCPDACPTDVQHLMAGFAQFERDDPADAAKLQPLFISVDPARDTPARLKTFTAAFHPRLLGLTGSDEAIAAAAKEYAAVYQRGTPAPNGQYLVDHSRTAILFGPHGEPIMILSQDGTPDKIARELATWVR
jgi:protein SCO1/2